MRKMDDSKRSTILNFINEYYDRYGRIPAVHDICVGTNIPNTTVHRYLVSMRESGELNYSGITGIVQVPLTVTVPNKYSSSIYPIGEYTLTVNIEK